MTDSPSIWPPVLMIILLIVLAVSAWRRRSVPGASVFVVACLFAVAWAAGSLMQDAAQDAAAQITWLKFQAAWQLPVVTAVTCFILEYAWPSRWLTRRNLALLSIAPLLALGLILTNDQHHLFWRSLAFDGSLTPTGGTGAWFFLAYAYGLGIVNLIVLTWLYMRSPMHRWPAALIVTGQLSARLLFTLDKTQVIQSALPLDVIVIGIAYLVYAIALFGFRLFDPVALARLTLMEQFSDGMLVLDTRGCVASLNPAAEQILRMPAGRIKGQRMKELLPAYLDAPLNDSGETRIEFSLGGGLTTRDFTLGISQMKDWRGLEVGRLLLLRDVTEPKRARELQKQQQLLLTVLQERERLARELHDSLGQTLAAAHIQASTAQLLLAQGETTQTGECLKQLAEMTIAAEVDVREYLLGARTSFTADRNFFELLCEYAARFSRQYDLNVELSVPPQLEVQGIGPSIEVQFMRIIQEALSNVRKHACAKNVRVIFTDSDTCVEVAVIDDGRGFDSAVVAQQSEQFGLQSMRERAESLGGSLEVLSQPGSGTRVIVHAPIQSEEGRREAD